MELLTWHEKLLSEMQSPTTYACISLIKHYLYYSSISSNAYE
jgi:hypothetical protein